MKVCCVYLKFDFQYQVILRSLLLLPVHLNYPKHIGMKVMEKTIGAVKMMVVIMMIMLEEMTAMEKVTEVMRVV